GPNFIDSHRQLWIVLSVKDKKNYLEHPIPVAPVAAPEQQELKTMFAQQAEQELLQTSRKGPEKQKKKSHKAAKGNQGKRKAKMGYAHVLAPSFAPKPTNHPPPKKDNLAKDGTFHQCGEVGHWRRNCPVYLVELLKKKKLSQGASTSGIFTIELYSFPSKYWVYDTSCGTHICITTQGLRGSRKLKPGALSLYVGDGHHATV
nr:zinc finger, CCHC-type [Tanacetum cinerariifolium]